MNGVRGVCIPPENIPKSLAPKSSNSAMTMCGRIGVEEEVVDVVVLEVVVLVVVVEGGV